MKMTEPTKHKLERQSFYTTAYEICKSFFQHTPGLTEGTVDGAYKAIFQHSPGLKEGTADGAYKAKFQHSPGLKREQQKEHTKLYSSIVQV